MSSLSYARIIVDRAIHRELDYVVPAAFAEKIGVGSRVRVPFRDKTALGTVVAMLDESMAEGLKPIESVLGDKPVLSAKLLELARWMSNYYCCPIETVMRSLLPQVIRRGEIVVENGKVIGQPGSGKYIPGVKFQRPMLPILSND